MGSGTAFLKVVAQNFDVLAGPIVALVYPLYASIRAIETKSPIDDQQWLTYWVLYSLITLFELTFAKLIEWLPFWSYTKLIVTCWLVIPYFSGAAYVYEHFVRPMFVNPQTVNIWYVPRKKDIFSKSDDILAAAEKYIEENGPEEFEKLMRKTGGSKLKTRRSESHRMYNEDESREVHNSYSLFDQAAHQAVNPLVLVARLFGFWFRCWNDRKRTDINVEKYPPGRSRIQNTVHVVQLMSPTWMHSYH